MLASLSAVMPRLDRGIQYAATYRLYNRCLWNTGSPDPVSAKGFAGPRTHSAAEALAKAASRAMTPNVWQDTNQVPATCEASR
ncbi:hypothetical protein ABIF63_001236 [Bradyrhizobium japonicum]|uniref:Uncharacterized protein n=1 Tax=Bradyrhizobium japonicum TaxID=375 RepID=A0ABV2RLG7_BRAJP